MVEKIAAHAEIVAHRTGVVEKIEHCVTVPYFRKWYLTLSACPDMYHDYHPRIRFWMSKNEIGTTLRYIL